MITYSDSRLILLLVFPDICASKSPSLLRVRAGPCSHWNPFLQAIWLVFSANSAATVCMYILQK